MMRPRGAAFAALCPVCAHHDIPVVEMKLSADDLKRTHEFLEETDLVKFAKMILTLEESRTHLTRSIDFVHATTPDEEEEKKEGGSG